MFICNRLCFHVTSLLFVLLQCCFVDSSMHCYVNYLAKNISTFFANNFSQSLKNTISELYAKHFCLVITLLLSNNQAVQISVVSPIISIQKR